MTALVEEGRSFADRPSSQLSAPQRRQTSLAWLGFTPFLAFVAVFLLFPTIVVASEAFKNKAGERSFTNLHKAISGEYFRAFRTTAHLSILTALAGGAIGLVLAYALVTLERPRFLKKAATTFSGVASQLGGIPLAFMFIATVGAQGFVTKTLNTWFHFKITDHGFSLYTFRGVALVYMYFQIPLMVIVMLPAIEGMKVQWREAAEGLGASRFQYWLRVGFPVLLPAALSGIILLFANAFSAYATAYALTSGQVNLVPIQIGFFLSGNTLDDPGLGFSLAFWMIVVVSSAIVLYNVLRRRTSRWQR